MCELIPEQDKFSSKKEHQPSLRSPQHKWHHSLIILEKLNSWGQYNGLYEENKQYSNQLGTTKDNQMMNQWNPSKLCLTSSNDKCLLMIK